jgi:hypothetical protein
MPPCWLGSPQSMNISHVKYVAPLSPSFSQISMMWPFVCARIGSVGAGIGLRTFGIARSSLLVLGHRDIDLVGRGTDVVVFRPIHLGGTDDISRTTGIDQDVGLAPESARRIQAVLTFDMRRSSLRVLARFDKEIVGQREHPVDHPPKG